jgi:hypothetical protein
MSEMDPISLSSAIKLMLDVKASLDSAALRSRVDEISKAVDAVGMHLVETTMTDVRQGFSHLEVALTATDRNVRAAELGFARQVFNRIASRSEHDNLISQYSAIPPGHVCALGDLGNYHYFLLQGQLEHALISAYRCTERFPALGVTVLPAGLFSQDWQPLLTDVDLTREALGREFRTAVDLHTAGRRDYLVGMAWRVPAAAGAVLAGFAAATVNPSLAGQGAIWATRILTTNDHGMLPKRGPKEESYLRLAEHAQKELLDQVIGEARQRRLSVEDSLGRE